MTLTLPQAPSGPAGRRNAASSRMGLLGLLACLVLPTPAAAQTPPAPPLPVTVSPSGYEDPIAAQARTRQEGLLKRMEESEFLFRNICVQCGGGVDGPGAYAPFEPTQALRAGPRS